MARSFLVIDDTPTVANLLAKAWRGSGDTFFQVARGAASLRRLRGGHDDAVVLTCASWDDETRASLQAAVAQARCQVAVVVAERGGVAHAVCAMQAGACDYLCGEMAGKVAVQALVVSLVAHMEDAAAGRTRRGSSAARAGGHAGRAHASVTNPADVAVATEADLQSWRDAFAPDIIGEHPLVLSVLHKVRRIAQTDCDVLLTGASGTGKELVARCIHDASRRRQKAFLALNCAAIPKELMESEIFGHARGAFTGATERRAGKFEAADGGSIFLDEVGEMELALQSKLLRVLQEREVTPVGASRLVKVDVRVVAATNQDLEQLCRDRAFRQDLYYRLNVVPLGLPSLAERRSDIPLLVHHFIKRANRRHARHIHGIDAAAATALCQYSWPGNIRELHNVIERIAVLKEDDTSIGVQDLPAGICQQISARGRSVSDTIMLPQGGLDINETLATMEERLTHEALERAGGNKARAAELLGLKRTTLVERLKKLNLAEAVS